MLWWFNEDYNRSMDRMHHPAAFNLVNAVRGEKLLRDKLGEGTYMKMIIDAAKKVPPR